MNMLESCWARRRLLADSIPLCGSQAWCTGRLEPQWYEACVEGYGGRRPSVRRLAAENNYKESRRYITWQTG